MNDIIERKFGELTVRIDRSVCISSESCIEAAPEIFYLDDEIRVNFKDEPSPIDPEKLIEACRVCPMDALSVTDESGRVIVAGP